MLANLARIYQLQKLPQAHTLAEKALALSPEWGGRAGHLGLAVALKTLGRTSEARKELHVIINSNQDLDWMDDVRELLDELSS